MGRYFFDIDNGDGFTPDHEGRDLATNSDIVEEIAKIVLDIANEEINGRDDVRIKVSVRDEASDPVAVSMMTFATIWQKPD